ncbi:MAG: tetratricopeptide repeat protein, partial [bacterium]|nr:tetratricopeptide repeat protein [bacterium]
MIKRILIIALLPLLILAKSDNPGRDPLFKQAVSAYAAEDYQSALAQFRDLAESGTVSWELYYNIGNSYYRLGETGPAIQYWEKAALLAPAHPDIRYNLSIVREQLIDKVVLPEMFPLFRWYGEMQKRLPLDRMIRLI